MKDPNNPNARSEREIFFQALDRATPEERAAFLDGACGQDLSLRRRVEALLARHFEKDSFMQGPAVEEVSTVIENAQPSEEVGTVIGRYKLLEKLGEGGFGAVWAAEQREPVRRRVALKIIKLGMDTKQVVARFEAEQQALALMDHPNIAKVLDAAATETGRPYFVMELVRGIPITQYCDQELLSPKERMDLFIKVCHAVQHAHQKGIIHRDIKPSNILVTLHDGVPVPKVIDFGIAKATQQQLTDKTIYTQFQQFIGTPAYMSPEQAEMSGLDIDTRSDIYSLGVLLYELLTGKTPFDAKELLAAGLDEMRRRIREEEPKRPSTRLSTLAGDELTTTARHRKTEAPKLINLLRGDLDWIVMKCLEKDRVRRYETANGLAQDIQRHLSNEPIVARPPSTAYRVHKFVRRNKLVVCAAGAGAGVLVVGVAVSTWLALVATRARHDEAKQRVSADQARRQAEVKEQEARRNLYMADMNLAYQAADADDLGRTHHLLLKHLPASDQEDFRQWEWRHLWRRCFNKPLLTLEQKLDRVRVLNFSSDGKVLAVGCMNGFIGLYETTAWKQVATLQGEGICWDVSFFPSSKLLAAAISTKRFGTAATEGSQMVRIWETSPPYRELPPLIHPKDVRSLDISFDNRLLATISAGDGVVRIWNLETREVLEVPSTTSSAVMQLRVRFLPQSHLLAIGEDNGKIRFVDAISAAEKGPPLDHQGGILALAFSPDGKTLASASLAPENTIKLWNVNSRAELRTFIGHRHWVRTLAFTPFGKTLVSGSFDQTIRLWDYKTGRQIHQIQAHEQGTWGLALSPDGRVLASAGQEGTIHLWDPDARPSESHFVVKPVAVRTLEAEPGALPQRQYQIGRWNSRRQSVAFAPDSKTFASVSTSGAILLWNTSTFENIGSVEALGTNNIAVLFSPDGRFVFTGEITGRIQVWDLLIQRVVTNLVADAVPTAPLRSLPAENTIVAEDFGNKIVRLWDTVRWKQRAVLQLDAGCWTIAFSPDGRTMATGNLEGRITLWNIPKAEKVASFIGHSNYALGLAFSPDGKTLASLNPRELKLWDVATQQKRAGPVFIHRGIGASVAISPEGERLAIEAGKPSIELRDLRTLQEVVSLNLGSPSGGQLAFSPDGSTLVSVGNKAIRLWRAPSLAEVEMPARQLQSQP